MTTFYCKDSPELHVGPNVKDEENIHFRQGFLEVALDDPQRDEKLRWIAHATPTFGIVNLGEETDLVPEGTGHPCDVCGAEFKTPFALKGHLRSHRPKA